MRKLLLLTVVFGIGSIFLAVSRGDKADPENFVRSWKAPPGKPYVKEGGSEPYAASWPTFAVIQTYASDVPGWAKAAVESDSTLFLMSHPKLNENNLVESIPGAARFATSCRGDARGRWIRLAPTPAKPVFVFVEATGGSCGNQLRIFGHGISYASPFVGGNVFQYHSFSENYKRACVSSVLTGDVDGNGCEEIVVSEMISFGRSNADSKYGYRLLDYKDGEFQVVKEISDDEFKTMKKLRKL